MNSAALGTLIDRWRDDVGGTYKTWFLWDERLKNFRSIRRGLGTVVEEISRGSFGNQYRGSSLETVVGSVAEQRQMFKGADHAFLWKPKLRIPDIYESVPNQRAFGRFLERCAGECTEHELVRAVHELDQLAIKGLGPASANLLYFLHPTLIAPSNTAIVKGYNAVTGSNVKLGRWREYLAMREGMLRINVEHRAQLSNDLGAVAALLFDIGSGRYPLPPLDPATSLAAWKADLARVGDRADKYSAKARESECTHTEVQGWLRDLGTALGYKVWIASNDRGRDYGTGLLGDGCLDCLPSAVAATAGADAVRLIDVLWFEGDHVAAAFEVEHSTSIYSGIVRLLDLAFGAPAQAARGLYLVAPDDREDKVRAQLQRPAFAHVATLGVRYLPYSELERNRGVMARFGHGLKAIEAVARALT